MRSLRGLLCMVLVAIGVPVVARAGDCIDYGDHLHWVGGIEIDGEPAALVVDGAYAYLAVAADSAGRLDIVDVRDPRLPVLAASLETPEPSSRSTSRRSAATSRSSELQQRRSRPK